MIGHKDIYPVLNWVAAMDSISSLLNYQTWNEDLSQRTNNILSYNFPSRKKLLITLSSDEQEKILANLESAWLNELSLLSQLDVEEQVFINWELSMFYYTIYCGVSALARITNPSLPLNHNNKVNEYNTVIIKQHSDFILPCFKISATVRAMTAYNQITDWDYGKKNHCKKIEDALKSILNPKKQSATVVDFFKFLREWANYNGVPLVKHFYGKTMKRELRDAMRNISFHFQVMVENMIISTIGYAPVKARFEEFKSTLKSNFELDAMSIEERFKTYEKLFT